MTASAPMPFDDRPSLAQDARKGCVFVAALTNA